VDVWWHRRLFRVSETACLTRWLRSAGYFNSDGQLWGIPLRLGCHEGQRIPMVDRTPAVPAPAFDLLRLDHFRALGVLLGSPLRRRHGPRGHCARRRGKNSANRPGLLGGIDLWPRISGSSLRRCWPCAMHSHFRECSCFSSPLTPARQSLPACTPRGECGRLHRHPRQRPP